ncbi:outer membrane beta-barrel protein [Winogradskyella sp.]|uniref:porin family protein n=2 Tax=Winogradskyella sp. TaxID=1883156 RepID=UPI003512E20D
MKKIALSVIIAFVSVIAMNAQEETNTSQNQKFGLRAGYSSFIAKVKVDGASASGDASGFYIGTFAEFELSDKFNLQPEITFANYSEDGESSSVLLVPVLVEFKANNELGLYAGPQFDYLLNEEDSEGLKRLGVGLSIGASYDISEDVFIDTRYTFGLTDRLDGDVEEFEGFNVKAKINYFQVGLGYRF